MAAARTDADVAADFAAYYMQRATRELAEDLDAVRAASDFRPDASVPLLVAALRQGAVAFSPAEQRRIVAAEPGAGTAVEAAAAEEEEAVAEEGGAGPRVGRGRSAPREAEETGKKGAGKAKSKVRGKGKGKGKEKAKR